ncbi:IclR family transcriptional regulator [Nitratireductor sp. ZSWI3]|uniref:IclR family transcriptional regulator n=1 Tax=Nitratireductor sp. ZSWI3 TaxID=2966359 RepID=UPI00214F64E7|nr:helix-turn-helix domain-containing protein [Nitratireductor sp. ZSWI3]MCR4265270.1 helix-turn-helix domain-containing protein [Nitratireductor sp. ZSWI3]
MAPDSGKLPEDANGDTPRGQAKYVGAVENAVAILRFLTQDHAASGVARVARETGINVSTTFNILRTLAKEGLISFDPSTKEYRPGIGLLEFSVPLLGTNQIDLIRPRLEQLSMKHKALIGLWKVTPLDRIILVDRVVEGSVVRVDMALGSRLPALVGAIGRCVAAAQKIPMRELHRRFGALRWQNPPSFEEYANDVVRAQATGFAFDRANLFQGLDIAASAVLDHEGQARLGISGIAITGQMSEPELDALAHELRDTAAYLSAMLYGRRAGEQSRTG